MPRMRPLRVERQLAAASDVARLLVGEEHFRARAAPLHRPAELLRREQQRAVLGIEVEAHAEAAADLLAPRCDLLRRHAEHRDSWPRMPSTPCVQACRVYWPRSGVEARRCRRAAPSGCRPRASCARRASPRVPRARTRRRSRPRRRLPKSNNRLPGTSSCSCGAPAASASAVATTAGRSRYSTATSSAASCAAAADSATTQATHSPT